MLQVGVPTYARDTVNLDASLFSFELVGACINKVFGDAKTHPSIEVCSSQPHFIGSDAGKDVFVGNGIHVADDEELLLGLKDPVDKLPKEREGRIGHDEVRLITQATHLLTAEVPIALHIAPLQVGEVDLAVARDVLREGEDLPPHTRLAGVVLRGILLEKRRLIWRTETLALRGVAGADELAESQLAEALRKVAGKLAPLRVIARQEHRLVAEEVGVVIDVRLQLTLYVRVLSVKLIVLGPLRTGEVFVCHCR